MKLFGLLFVVAAASAAPQLFGDKNYPYDKQFSNVQQFLNEDKILANSNQQFINGDQEFNNRDQKSNGGDYPYRSGDQQFSNEGAPSDQFFSQQFNSGDQQFIGNNRVISDDQQFIRNDQKFISNDQKFIGNDQKFSGGDQQFVIHQKPQIRIVSQKFEQDVHGNYEYGYEQDNGQKMEERGSVQPGPEPETGRLVKDGYYEYVSDDGNTYRIIYRADENGFQAHGAHLPQPPAQIPEYEQLRREHPELFWAENLIVPSQTQFDQQQFIQQPQLDQQSKFDKQPYQQVFNQ